MTTKALQMPVELNDNDFFSLVEEIRVVCDGGPILGSEVDDDPPHAALLRAAGVDVEAIRGYLFKAALRLEEGYVEFEFNDDFVGRIPAECLRDKKNNRTSRIANRRYQLRVGTQHRARYIRGSELTAGIKNLGAHKLGPHFILRGVLINVIAELDRHLHLAGLNSNDRHQIIADMINWRLGRSGRPIEGGFTPEKIRQTLKNSSATKHYGKKRACLPLCLPLKTNRPSFTKRF